MTATSWNSWNPAPLDIAGHERFEMYVLAVSRILEGDSVQRAGESSMIS
jgi:hypothetical protein